MRRVSQFLLCVHKFHTLPSHTPLSFRTLSSVVCFLGNKNRAPLTSNSVIQNCCTSRTISNLKKCCLVTSYPNYGNHKVQTTPSTAFNHNIFKNNALMFQMSNFMTPLLSSALNYSTSITQSETTPDVSASHKPLQVKRPLRKKLQPVSDDHREVQVDNVVAYALAEDINISSLKKHLVKQGLYNIGNLPQDVTYALHVRGKYNVDQKQKEIFIFEDGSVIFWCVPEVERDTFLKMLSTFSQGTYSSSLAYEREEIDFTFTSGKTSLAGDVIQLNEGDRDSLPRLLEMYAFSNALAQSVKLAMWEASFNKFVESIENVTEDLRKGRKISMSRQQVLMKTGELFSLRHLINLSSDLLDTPDFYWDREALEPLYVSLCNYLSISRRTKVMNQKLNHCCELTELLSSHLNNTHHIRLEVMIIVLILIEVVFEIVHTIERYWNNQPAHTVEHVTDGEVIKDSSKLVIH